MGISFCVFLGEKLKDAKWVMPFVAVGQTTLTLYIGHTLIGTLVIWAMDFMDMETELFAIWGTLLYLMGALIFCMFWNKRYKRGPLELVMRQFLALPGRLTVTGTPPVDLTKST